MRVYVASHDKELASVAAHELTSGGHHILSTWHQLEFKPTDEHPEWNRRVIAKRDADEVSMADAVVLIAGPDRYPGGKFVEVGIAIGQGKPVVVIGRRENMLMWHRNVIGAANAKEAAAILSGITRGANDGSAG
jgi:nucleoside 2-deoxyribosyltransferase